MSTSTIGLLAGLLLTLVITTGGFLGLLLAVVLGGAGWFAGRHLDGEVDLSEIVRGRRG